MERFWVIWREDGCLPTKKHRTKADAVKEAERLAKKHPDSAFHVLENTGTCKTVVAPVRWEWPEMMSIRMTTTGVNNFDNTFPGWFDSTTL